MQETKQQEVRTEVDKFMVRTFEEEQCKDEFGDPIKGAYERVEKTEFTAPEYLRKYIEMADYWWRVKEACGMVNPDSMDEDELLCLMAASEGVRRAQKAMEKEPAD